MTRSDSAVVIVKVVIHKVVVARLAVMVKDEGVADVVEWQTFIANQAAGGHDKWLMWLLDGVNRMLLNDCELVNDVA